MFPTATSVPIAPPLIFPDDVPVQSRTVCRQYVSIPEHLPVTAANWCPLGDDQRHLAHLFDPRSHEDSNVGAGRSALALAQVIIDFTMVAQEAWRTELVESLIFPGDV